MQKFVFWTGVYNILLGACFFIPDVPELLCINITDSNFWIWLPALLVIYLGILLILCSRNLNVRGSLVYWEGILRIAVSILLGYFGFFGNLGSMLGFIGIIDLLIGIVYLLGLPGALSTSHSNLFTDNLS